MFVAKKTFRIKRGPEQKVVWIKPGNAVPEAARWSRSRRNQFVEWKGTEPMPEAPRGSSSRGAYREKGEEAPTPEKKTDAELAAELESEANAEEDGASCSAETQAGNPCTRKAAGEHEGSPYCPQHLSQKTG